MMKLMRVIGTPVQAHAVDSAEAYLDKARKYRAAHGLDPILTVRPEQPMAFVSDGRWVIDCDCGNGPSASHEWAGLAVCFECGSVYQARFPGDRAQAEEALLARPSPLQRHYYPDDETAKRAGLPKAENAASLRAENRAHGVGRKGR